MVIKLVVNQIFSDYTDDQLYKNKYHLRVQPFVKYPEGPQQGMFYKLTKHNLNYIGSSFLHKGVNQLVDGLSQTYTQILE